MNKYVENILKLNVERTENLNNNFIDKYKNFTSEIYYQNEIPYMKVSFITKYKVCDEFYDAKITIPKIDISKIDAGVLIDIQKINTCDGKGE